MNTKKNPFNPTFGNVPSIFLDKDKQIAHLIDEIKESDFARSYFITGVRGSGKTSFLSKISSTLAEDKKCILIDLINEEDIVTNFTQKLYRKTVDIIPEILSHLSKISIGGLTFEKKENLSSIELTLEELMENIKKKQKYVVITIDEVTNTPNIWKFAKIFDSLKRKEYPIFVLMTGLPDIVLDIQKNDTLTFLLRSDKIEMMPLTNQDVVFSYLKEFNENYEVADKMADLTKGYSYAFQLQGSLYFNYLKHENVEPSLETLEKIYNSYKGLLFENAYQKIFVDLSDKDREYLLAINQSPIFKDTVAIMNKSATYVSQYRRRMLERHLIEPIGHGKVAFTLPLFSEYLTETQNEDSKFYWPI